MASKSIGVSKRSRVTGRAETPAKTTFSGPSWHGPPPAPSSSSRSGVPIGSSYTPGRRMSPETVNSIVPGHPSVPSERKRSAPSRRISGTFASVSGLFTNVGFGEPRRANSPTRYGGKIRGSGSLPSTTSSSAFSSPNRYSSGPATSSMGTGPSMPLARSSTIARRSRRISRW
jgi:hypothetical protein